MPITLSNLKPAAGSRTRSKRLGRGNASGKGTYSGKGIKGQKARSGGRKGLKLLGLKRIFQRVPKHRGFKSIHPKPTLVNVKDLQAYFAAAAVVSPQILEAAGLVRTSRNGVKILGDGTLNKALTVQDCEVSKSAREKIEKAGGRIE